MTILHCSANARKKFKIADSQSPPENQVKCSNLSHSNILIKWVANLGNFPADSGTGTPWIDIKLFELNFERFDVKSTFLMQMSHAKLEITKTKEEQVWNVLEMHLTMISSSLLINDKMVVYPWEKSDSFLSFSQSVIP